MDTFNPKFSDEEKIQWIKINLPNLEGEDLCKTIGEICPHLMHPVALVMYQHLGQRPEEAKKVVQFLFNNAAPPEEDFSGNYIYTAAGIIQYSGIPFEPEMVIPPLVKGYSFEYYRDVNHAIAWAVKTVLEYPIRMVAREAKQILPEHKDGLYSQVYSYSLLDIREFEED